MFNYWNDAIPLTHRQRCTVLAALRHWQDRLLGLSLDQDKLTAIATNSGTATPLSVDEIDGLCVSLAP